MLELIQVISHVVIVIEEQNIAIITRTEVPQRIIKSK